MSVLVALKALAIWAGILVLAAINGALRESVLIPALGTAAGFFLSGVLLSALIIFVAYISSRWMGARRPAEFIGIGLIWLALTLVFEFSFGRWQGKSWEVLLDGYTFKNGNIWPVVLLVTAMAPYLAGKLRRPVSEKPGQRRFDYPDSVCRHRGNRPRPD